MESKSKKGKEEGRERGRERGREGGNKKGRKEKKKTKEKNYKIRRPTTFSQPQLPPKTLIQTNELYCIKIEL